MCVYIFVYIHMYGLSQNRLAPKMSMFPLKTVFFKTKGSIHDIFKRTKKQFFGISKSSLQSGHTVAALTLAGSGPKRMQEQKTNLPRP